MNGFRSLVYLWLLALVLHCVPNVSAAPADNSGKAGSGKSAKAQAKVDLNSAMKAELEALPGVGPETANEIIAARPFKSVAQLKEVRGIGEERYSRIRNQVTVRRERTGGASPASEQTKAQREQRDQRGSRSARSDTAPTTRVDLNTADAKTLESLPGVGPATAQAIIAARPFKSVEELKDVEGIGEARFEQARPWVTVRGEARSQREASGTAASTSRGQSEERRSVSRPNDELGGSQRGSNHAAQGRVNINTASQQDLESLLGIGPVKARAIIEGRPYKSVEEVMEVKGIKEGTFEQIKDRITVR